MKYQRPKGTRDIYARELKRIEKINSLAREFFEAGGYIEMKTPTFEYAELFARSVGENTDIVEKEMYVFEVNKRKYVLRPEGTASVLRAFIENNLSAPARIFYIGSMFRKERPQKGRYREFLQIGVELLGEGAPFYDAEMVEQAKRFLDLIRARDFTIEINSIGCPACRKLYQKKLLMFLKPKMNQVCEDCQRRFQRNFLRIFDCKNETCQQVYTDAPKITDNLCEQCFEHYTQVKRFLDSLSVQYIENKKLVRGLDYYTRTVFEFKIPGLGAQNTILAGGRYDLLMKQLGGKDIPCLGWAVGVERLLLTLPQHLPEIKLKKKFFVIGMGERFINEMIKIRNQIQNKDGICILGDPDTTIKRQLKRANRFDTDFVIIYGEDEEKKGYYTVRNMQSGEQKPVLKDNFPEYLKKLL